MIVMEARALLRAVGGLVVLVRKMMMVMVMVIVMVVLCVALRLSQLSRSLLGPCY